jgi:hypothetical protein
LKEDDNMGFMLNPEAGIFETHQGPLYIDKTGLIDQINIRVNSASNFICLSRPRRFGKSLTADMLSTYYGKNLKSGRLFKGLKIRSMPSYRKHLNKYNVIFIDMGNYITTSPDVSTMVKTIEDKLMVELRGAFTDVKSGGNITLLETLYYIYEKTGTQFIVIIDEWDCVFREHPSDVTGQKTYLNFLRSIFKTTKKHIALAYMTGILPIKKYGTQSALNMFHEYSMSNPGPFAEYIGFTDTEVQEKCKRFNMDYSKIKDWYDGYKLGNLHIYSPLSVYRALRDNNIANYWTQTESYESLKGYIGEAFPGLQQTVAYLLDNPNAKKKISTDLFQNDVTSFKSADDVLTLLVHLGYLSFDAATSEVSIPNREVAESFKKSLGDPVVDVLLEISKVSKRILDFTLSKDAVNLAKAIEEVHDRVTKMNYNTEEALSNVISWSYVSALAYYDDFYELPSGKGFLDALFVPKRTQFGKPALLIELKWDLSAKTAIQQIKEKNYPDKVKLIFGSNILLVGINYSTKDKKHTCIIETFKIL